LVGLAEARLLGNQRPEEVHHPPGQAAYGQDGHLPSGCQLWEADGFVVGGGQGALGHDYQNRPGRDAGGEQVQETPDASGGLARAGWAFEEDFALYGALDERSLMFGRGKRGHAG
jgi:hypothetical protein